MLQTSNMMNNAMCDEVWVFVKVFDIVTLRSEGRFTLTRMNDVVEGG